MERPPVPKWFDLLLITSAAWNGMMMGILSLLQVDQFISKFLRPLISRVLITCILPLTAFGIYLGRFLRFNSWEIITDPMPIIYAIGTRIIHPHEHVRTWAFTFLFGGMLYLVYEIIRNAMVYTNARQFRKDSAEKV
jgi:uncharacterized membrane protein